MAEEIPNRSPFHGERIMREETRLLLCLLPLMISILRWLLLCRSAKVLFRLELGKDYYSKHVCDWIRFDEERERENLFV